MSRLEAEFNKDMYSMLTTPCGSRTGCKRTATAFQCLIHVRHDEA